MRKEVALAILFGLTVGLVIAFGVWRANNAYQSKQSSTSDTPEATQNTADDKPEELTISLLKLEENDIVTESPLNISGITKPNTHIVISAEDEDYILISDRQGNFQSDIDLVGGVNQLILSVYDGEGLSSSQNINVIYSTEFNDIEDE